MNYRPAFMLALPFVAAFVLIVFVLIVAPPAIAAPLEDFPPPLPLDELPPTGHSTVDVLGLEVPVVALLAVVAFALLFAAALVVPAIRTAPRDLAAWREKRAARRG